MTTPRREKIRRILLSSFARDAQAANARPSARTVRYFGNTRTRLVHGIDANNINSAVVIRCFYKMAVTVRSHGEKRALLSITISILLDPLREQPGKGFQDCVIFCWQGRYRQLLGRVFALAYLAFYLCSNGSIPYQPAANRKVTP